MSGRECCAVFDLLCFLCHLSSVVPALFPSLLGSASQGASHFPGPEIKDRSDRKMLTVNAYSSVLIELWSINAISAAVLFNFLAL